MLRLWLWLIPFALAFAPTFAWLVDRWTASIFRNGHGIFVPFLIAYLAHDQLKQERDPTPSSSPLGFAFIGASVVLLALDSAINTQLLAAFALVVAIPGVSLLLLGARRTRSIALPLSLGVFMLPIPAGAIAQLLMVLRLQTAWAVSHLVPLFGIPLSREGTQLEIPGQLIEVADNCSGFATLYAAVLTGIILAHLGRAPARRVAVLLAAVPLAILCNFVRVTALVLLVHHYGAGILDTQMHPASGLLLFVVVIALLVAIAGRDSLHATPGGGRVTPSSRGSTALLAAFSLALVPVTLHSYLHVRSDDCANPQALVPAMSPGAVTPDRDAEIHRSFDVYQWREGKLAAGSGAPELSFAVIRSYDSKQLYYRGMTRLWPDVKAGEDTVEWLEADGAKLPIVSGRPAHARPRESQPLFKALLVYEGQPVANGWRAQLRAAPRQAFTGSRPMTLFAVRGSVPDEQREAMEKRANQWLLDSWRNYRLICGE